MAVCQRTWEDREEGEEGGGGEKMHNALCSSGVVRMQGGELRPRSVREGQKQNKKQTDRWPMWQRKVNDGEETD